ncbi:SOS response-associated peptidase [Flavobacterium sp.]|uniref:SOS response-associated peptidase n=1 Tax=Flavobacterium sp. TaxID=239 RepID=UPI0025E983D2|nr:SOS response-associated peptidase [Flavobacterium sp.]
MCYYYGLDADFETIEHHYGVKHHPPVQYWDKRPPSPSGMINGFGHPRLPIIKQQQEKEIVLGEWGLIPHWAKDISQFRKGANTLNAMIETVAEKPSYRDSLKRRCLVVVSEFYEYKWMDEKGKVKILHNIKATGKDLFSLAGIYSPFKDPNTGELIDSYTILTTEANTLMAEIHNTKKRMPVVLHKDEEELWLNDDAMEHYFCRKEIELEATPLPKPGQELFLF